MSDETTETPADIEPAPPLNEAPAPAVEIVTTVTVIAAPGHEHNGQPCGGQPITLTPELAEHLISAGLAHLED